ncbi:MAG: metal ABC transporter permease [Firmicutes bacterium]|jgi:ABC-type Mn2+/Zn2+ transport system permease subunit|nr:metal ABC transporter permease [Bacillota bacterium]
MSQFSVLTLPFMQRAVVALVFSSMTLSLLGIVVLVFNLAAVRFALMHMGLLGATVGLATGTDPTMAGLAAITGGAFLLGPVSDRTRLDTGAASAFFMTGSLAIAFILLYKANIPAMDAFSVFTGSVLMLTPTDMWTLLLLGTCVVLAMVIWYWEINLVLYNRDLAAALGVNTRLIYYVLLVFLGLAIGIAMKLVGALMVDAIVLLPAMVALPLSRSLRQALLLTSLIGGASSMVGIAASLTWDWPISASVTIAGVLAVFVGQMVQYVIRRLRMQQEDLPHASKGSAKR